MARTSRASPAKAMAKVLAETVVELSNPIKCRRTLAFVGFTDKQMNVHLDNARRKATHIRIAEIERRLKRLHR